MDPQDITYQAEAYLDWLRGRAVGWPSFDAWATTKDFQPRDKAAIWRTVLAITKHRETA